MHNNNNKNQKKRSKPVRKTAVTISLVSIALAAAGFYYFASTHTAVDLTAQPPEQNAAQTSQALSAIRPADVLKRLEPPSPEQLKATYQTFMANRPAYLADVELPAQYEVDEQGNLILNAAVKDLLDYFMLGTGDIAFDQLHDIIAGNMHSSLQEPALSQALELLDRYFSYIDSYDVWEKGFDQNQLLASNPVAMRDALQELENLRRQHLGDATYDAFFAEETQANKAYVEARIALQQPALTTQEKTEIASTLEQSLPESMRVAQQQAMTQVNLAEKTRELRDSGASDQAVHAARVEMVGEAAALRLQVMDGENRAWEKKRASYKALFSTIPGTEGLSQEEKVQYIAEVAQKELGLSESELKRMQALDRIDAAEAVH